MYVCVVGGRGGGEMICLPQAPLLGLGENCPPRIPVFHPAWPKPEVKRQQPGK